MLESEAPAAEFGKQANEVCRTYSESVSDLTPSATDMGMMTDT